MDENILQKGAHSFGPNNKTEKASIFNIKTSLVQYYSINNSSYVDSKWKIRKKDLNFISYIQKRIFKFLKHSDFMTSMVIVKRSITGIRNIICRDGWLSGWQWLKPIKRWYGLPDKKFSTPKFKKIILNDRFLYM